MKKSLTTNNRNQLKGVERLQSFHIPAISASIYLLFFLLSAWTAQAAPVHILEDITFEALSNQEERIIFQLNGTHVPKIFTIDGEKPRVVFDFTNTETASIVNNIINTNGKLIKQIRVGIHDGAKPKTRVVLDLLPNQKIDYEQNFDKNKNRLVVSIHHEGVKPVKQVEKPVKIQPTAMKEEAVQTKKPADKPAQQPDIVETAPQAEPVSPPPTEQAKTDIIDDDSSVLNSVTFDNSSNKGEMILFKLNNFHPPIVFGLEEGTPRVVCDFKDTRIGQGIPNTIKTDGKYVRSIRVGKKNAPDKIRVVLDLVPSHSYDLQQVFFKEDNLFVIIINTMSTAASTPPENPLK